uniref:Transmembrane protein n=1 Tax=Steinernema glaseri TaxID=37863 RepID=A0A1I7YEQ7_9BILA
MSLFSLVRISICAVLIVRGIVQFLNDDFWWIDAPIYVSAAVLNLRPAVGCKTWRTFSALAILLGALHAGFFSWSVAHIQRAAVIADDEFSLAEGKRVLLTAAATALTVSTRLSRDSYSSVLAIPRTLLMVAIGVGSILAACYSSCFYRNDLPYCSLI